MGKRDVFPRRKRGKIYRIVKRQPEFVRGEKGARRAPECFDRARKIPSEKPRGTRLLEKSSSAQKTFTIRQGEYGRRRKSFLCKKFFCGEEARDRLCRRKKDRGLGGEIFAERRKKDSPPRKYKDSRRRKDFGECKKEFPRERNGVDCREFCTP